MLDVAGGFYCMGTMSRLLGGLSPSQFAQRHGRTLCVLFAVGGLVEYGMIHGRFYRTLCGLMSLLVFVACFVRRLVHHGTCEATCGENGDGCAHSC